MIKALVLLLTLPPLLMPPGMCICQFARAGRTPAAPASPVPARQPAASHVVSRADCSCDSCRARTPAARGGERQAPTEREPLGPGGHCPGCPAAVGAVPQSAVVPAATVGVDFCNPVGLITPVVEPVVPLARVPSTPPPFASQPIFISHCTLLI